MRGFTPIGYYKDPEKSAATFQVIDGVRYSIPGDFATVDTDGTVRLLGRGSQCINTGGEKVYPEEVEEILKPHPTVADAAVVGDPRRALRRGHLRPRRTACRRHDRRGHAHRPREGAPRLLQGAEADRRHRIRRTSRQRQARLQGSLRDERPEQLEERGGRGGGGGGGGAGPTGWGPMREQPTRLDRGGGGGGGGRGEETGSSPVERVGGGGGGRGEGGREGGEEGGEREEGGGGGGGGGGRGGGGGEGEDGGGVRGLEGGLWRQEGEHRGGRGGVWFLLGGDGDLRTGSGHASVAAPRDVTSWTDVRTSGRRREGALGHLADDDRPDRPSASPPSSSCCRTAIRSRSTSCS